MIQQNPHKYFFRPPPPFKKGMQGAHPPPGASTSRPGEQLQSLPQVFHFNFEDPKVAKKWNNPKEDITDYFNYGFNEESWRIYAEKVKKTFAKKADLCPAFDPNLSHFCQSLPLDIGGFGRPVLHSTKQVPFVKAALDHPDYFMDTLMRCPNPKTLEIMFDKCLYEKELGEVYEALEQEYEDISPTIMKMSRKLTPEVNDLLHQTPHLHQSSKSHLHPLEVLKAANQRKQLLHGNAGMGLLTYEDINSLAQLFGSIFKLPDLQKPAEASSSQQPLLTPHLPLSRRVSVAEEKQSANKSDTRDTGAPTTSNKDRTPSSTSSSASDSSSSRSRSSASSSSSRSGEHRPAAKSGRREAKHSKDSLKSKLKLKRRDSRERSRERSSEKRGKLKVKKRDRSRSRGRAESRRNPSAKSKPPAERRNKRPKFARSHRR